LQEVVVVKIQIALDLPVFRALRLLADEEYRDPRAQASIIIFKELERRGLVEPQKVEKNSQIEVKSGSQI
jgi:hypothetical protein